jgi:MFS family permease
VRALPRRWRVGPLQERPFRLLWIARTTSLVGDAVSGIALAFAVLSVSRSASALGLVLATFTLSRVVFILVGGVWSDRLSRRRVMIASDVIRCAAQLVVGALLVVGAAELWHLAAGAALVGGSTAFFGPASTGLVPQTVSPDRLQQANALISTSESASFLAGPAVSGFLIAAFSPGVAFIVDSASYAVSAGFLVALRVGDHATTASRGTFLEDLARGWHEVRSRTWLKAGLVTFSISNVAIAVFFVLGPIVFTDEFRGASDWGIAMTIGAVGGISGSALALRYRPRYPLRSSFPLILLVAVALLTLVPPTPVVVIGAASGGMFAGINLGNALWDTMLQQHVPREMLSRVDSYDWLISLVFTPVGYTVAGPLAETVGRDTTLVGAAVICAAANVLVLVVPSVRHLPRLDVAGVGAERSGS